MPLTTAQIQTAYVTFFNRPADVAGLAYWSTYTGSNIDLYNTFAQSSEYTSLFAGQNTTATINTIYGNLLGRAPDVTGLAYWVNQMDRGLLSIGTIANAIRAGAQGSDATTIANKTTAATTFTTALDTTAEIVGYASPSASSLAAVKAWLAAVTTDATLTTQTTAAAVTTITTTVANGAANNGSTFTLTSGVDNVTGTANNDTIVGTHSATAASNTFSAFDTITGGSGTDTLSITALDYANNDAFAAATVSSVENIAIRALDATAADILIVTATNFTGGALDFNSDRSTSAVTFTGLAAGQSATITGNGVVTNGALNATYANTVTAGVINVAGGTLAGVVTEAGTGITSNTINSTGAANVLTNVVLSGAANTALTINATTNLTTGNITGFTGTTSTITVNGAATAVDIGTLENTTVKTVNAAGLTAGGVTTTLNTNTGLNFTGGAGNDIVTAGAVLVTGASVDAAAGTADRLVITADAQLTTATAPFYKGFEVLQANTGVTADVSQLAANNTVTAIRINDSASSTVAVNGLNATQAAAVSIIAAADATGAITLGLTGASNGGQIDTVKAALTTMTTAGAAQVSNLTGLTLTGVEKLELTGNGTTAGNTGAVTLTTTNATVLDSIKLSNAGANTVTIAAGHTAANLSVDASGSTGATTINAALYNTTTGATLTGGAGNDAIAGSAKVDTIVGGAGNDVIIGDAAAEVQTITMSAATGGVAATIAVVIGGVTVTTASVANNATAGAAGTAVFTALNANATLLAAGYTFADNTTGVVTVTAPAAAGNIAAATVNVGTLTMVAPAIATTTDGASQLVGDTLTGGAGNDTFNMGAANGANTVANMDTITDLDFGAATTSTDVLVFGNANGTKSVVTLSVAQQATVTAAASLAAAADAALAVISTDGATGTFTYGANTYVVHNGDGGATFTATADYVIKVTGVAGTLDTSDFTLV